MNIEQTSSKRNYLPKLCLYCGNEIPIGNLKVSDYNRKKFCNRSCAASYNNSIRTRKPWKKQNAENNYCKNCGIAIPSTRAYCSPTCQHAYEQQQWEEKWLSGEVDGNMDSIWTQTSKRVRTYLFKKYDSKCANCGWGEVNPYTSTIPLEIEHIDSDAYNSRPENLILLCPNCHSLTATYRGANRGKGRKKTWVPKPS